MVELPKINVRICINKETRELIKILKQERHRIEKLGNDLKKQIIKFESIPFVKRFSE